MSTRVRAPVPQPTSSARLGLATPDQAANRSASGTEYRPMNRLYASAATSKVTLRRYSGTRLPLRVMTIAGPWGGSVVGLLDDAAAEDLLDDGTPDVARLLDVLVVVAHGGVVGDGLPRLVVGRARTPRPRPGLGERLPNGARAPHRGVRRGLSPGAATCRGATRRCPCGGRRGRRRSRRRRGGGPGGPVRGRTRRRSPAGIVLERPAGDRAQPGVGERRASGRGRSTLAAGPGRSAAPGAGGLMPRAGITP